MKFLYLCVLFIIDFSFSTASMAKNSFLVAPGIVNFNLNKPATQSFIITNNGDEKIRLKIEPVYYAPDSKSLNLGKHIHSDTAALESLMGTLRVSPRRLSLKPGQRRDIRVSIRPKSGLPDGDYRSHLVVKMLETAYAIKTGDAANGGVAMKLNIKLQMGIALNGSIGERAEADLAFSCTKHPTTNNLILTVKNASQWRFSGLITIKSNAPAKENLYDKRTVVLRDTIRDIIVETPYNDQPLRISYSRLATPELVKKATCGVI